MPLLHLGTAPVVTNTKAPAIENDFGAHLHSFSANRLRFHAAITGLRARLASGWWQTFTGRISSPAAGLRWESADSTGEFQVDFHVFYSNAPGFAWRHVTPFIKR